MKNFRFSKTVDEFMKITGVTDQETIVRYLIIGHSANLERMDKIQQIRLNLQQLGLTSEQIDDLLIKLDSRLSK